MPASEQTSPARELLNTMQKSTERKHEALRQPLLRKPATQVIHALMRLAPLHPFAPGLYEQREADNENHARIDGEIIAVDEMPVRSST